METFRKIWRCGTKAFSSFRSVALAPSHKYILNMGEFDSFSSTYNKGTLGHFYCVLQTKIA